MRERKPIDAALRSFLDAQAAAAVAPAPASMRSWYAHGGRSW